MTSNKYEKFSFSTKYPNAIFHVANWRNLNNYFCYLFFASMKCWHHNISHSSKGKEWLLTHKKNYHEKIIGFKMKKLLLGLYFYVSFQTYCLQLLDLSRNNLNGFDDNQVWKLRQIKDVKLENNPLICDRCHMGALIDIARTVCIIL